MNQKENKVYFRSREGLVIIPECSICGETHTHGKNSGDLFGEDEAPTRSSHCNGKSVNYKLILADDAKVPKEYINELEIEEYEINYEVVPAKHLQYS